MDPYTISEIQSLVDQKKFYPEVSLTIPITNGQDLGQALLEQTDEIRTVAEKAYPHRRSQLIINKFRQFAENAHYATNAPGIALTISPVFEKLSFLDYAPDYEIVLDDAAYIRKLLYGGKTDKPYVLLLDYTECALLKWKSKSLLPICTFTFPVKTLGGLTNGLQQLYKALSFAPKRDTWIENIDEAVSRYLNVNNTLLVVIGRSDLIRNFTKRSEYRRTVIAAMRGKFQLSNMKKIRHSLSPISKKIDSLIITHYLDALESRMAEGRAWEGLEAINKAITEKKGNTLIVEKNYHYERPADTTAELTAWPKLNGQSQDAVDEVCAKVIAMCGRVVFAEDDLLANHGRMILLAS